MVSYRKLWVRLAEREMKKLELAKSVGFSGSTLAKMGRNEYVALKVLVEICLFLDCQIEDIMEIIPVDKAHNPA